MNTAPIFSAATAISFETAGSIVEESINSVPFFTFLIELRKKHSIFFPHTEPLSFLHQHRFHKRMEWKESWLTWGCHLVLCKLPGHSEWKVALWGCGLLSLLLHLESQRPKHRRDHWTSYQWSKHFPRWYQAPIKLTHAFWRRLYLSDWRKHANIFCFRHKQTQSVLCFNLGVTWAPMSCSSLQDSGKRSVATMGYPFFNRFLAMGLPIFPRPIKPTGVFEAIDRDDTGER